jgi:hypothetical protein
MQAENVTKRQEIGQPACPAPRQRADKESPHRNAQIV